MGAWWCAEFFYLCLSRMPTQWLHVLGRAPAVGHAGCGAFRLGSGAQLRRIAPVLAGAAGAALLWPASPALQEQSEPKAPETGAKKPQRTVNVDQEMLKSRRLFLTGEVNDDSAKVLVQQLLFLEADDPEAPVTIFINSGGGLVHSGLAILDVMRNVSTPLKTVGYGRCFSIAAVLLAAGTPGHRSAYENARLMIHEPSCSYPKLSASDVILKAEELRHTKETLEFVLSVLTGKPKADIVDAVARDRYMSVQEAKSFGLLDTVISRGGVKAEVPPEDTEMAGTSAKE